MDTQTAKQVIAQCSALVPDVLKFKVRNMWIDYDDEADVLYISFRKPQRAGKTIE